MPGRTHCREVIDPSTGRVVGEVPEASPDDVAAAVAAARAAQPAWQALGVDGRGECFRRFGELLSRAARRTGDAGRARLGQSGARDAHRY